MFHAASIESGPLDDKLKIRIGAAGAATAGRHAAAFGLSLTDPSAPLGDEQRCRGVLREAGFVPDAVAAERIRFGRADLGDAWEAHVRGPHHDAMHRLTPDQQRQFRDAYAAELTGLLEGDEDSVRDAEVMYAFGRKE